MKFQHRAGAYGIGGKFLWPVQGQLDVRPSVELPPTGGIAKDLEENYNFQEFVTFRRAYTEVSGAPNEEIVGDKKIPAHNNLSLTVIDEFNLLHVVEVRKIVSRITTRYFEGYPEMEIVLSGTRFEGFRIFGQEIVVKLATDLFLKNPTFPDLRKSYEAGGEFPDRYHKLSGGKPVPETSCAPFTLSLVEGIHVPSATTEFSVYGNRIEIPHVGRLFLAELTVTGNSKSLNMIRWELGCPSGGDGNIGGGTGGGVINP